MAQGKQCIHQGSTWMLKIAHLCSVRDKLGTEIIKSLLPN